MPRIDEVQVAPEYQGKTMLGKKDPQANLDLQGVFEASKGKYKVVILDPKLNIPHAPTFFEDPMIPVDGVSVSQTFNNGREAYENSNKMLKEVINNYSKENKNLTGYNVYALILSESQNGALVQGFIQAEVNNDSIKYFVANNPNPSVLKPMQPENIMGEN